MNKSKVLKPLFITIEGVEGVGKSTCSIYIKNVLKQYGKKVLLTREPGGTKLAESIRDLLLIKTRETLLPETELLLLFAARAQHCENVIRPYLKKGYWVISDRFTDASYAYQGAGRGVNNKWINMLARFIHPDLVPDMTFLLDAPLNVLQERIQKRKFLDRIEKENLDFFLRAKSGYYKLAKKFPKRFKIINVNQPLIKVKKDIGLILKNYLEK